jgi:hypothetical protein
MSSNVITLRGLLEKTIDEQLTEQPLATAHELFEALRPAVSKREDAIFGYIVGWTTATVYSLYTRIVNRPFTQEEINEVAGTITRRSLEIKHRIMETST